MKAVLLLLSLHAQISLRCKQLKNLDRAHLINIFINTVNKNLCTLLVYAFACLLPLLLVCLFAYCRYVNFG